MIEDAWNEGFDPQGASQLNNKLQGTKAWIGACEIYTLLTSLKVKYVLADYSDISVFLCKLPALSSVRLKLATVLAMFSC